MKKLYILVIAVLFCSAGNSQELDSLINIMESERGENMTQEDNPTEPPSPVQESFEAPLPPEENTESYEEHEDYDMENGEEHHDNEDPEEDEDSHRKFKGHWAGIDIGLNNFFNDDFTVTRDEEASFMDIKTARSLAVNLNFSQYSLAIVPGYAGFVTGMGLEFNNYFFEDDISINENNDQIEIISLSGTNYVRSKLSTIYIRVPLLFEIQFPGFGERAFIAAGLTGSLRLDAHTKVVYKEGDEKTKDKNWDDFNLNTFRYGLTVRIGSGNSNIFFDYQLRPFFAEGKGPELYPFSVGFSATF